MYSVFSGCGERQIPGISAEIPMLALVKSGAIRVFSHVVIIGYLDKKFAF